MSGILGSVVVCGLAAGVVAMLSRVGLQARRDRPGQKFPGWRQIKPGPMHWTAALLSAALFIFMSWIWLFVGSSRPDGAQQMRILFWLIVAFGSGSIVAAASIHAISRRAVRWRGRTIAYASNGGDAVARRTFGDIAGMRTGITGVHIQFKDGSSVVVDPYAVGGAELLESITDHITPNALPPGTSSQTPQPGE